MPVLAFGRLEYAGILHEHVIDDAIALIFGQVIEDGLEVVRGSKIIGLTGLGDDVANIDGFALRAFDQCFLNVGYEEIGDDTGVQAARSNDDDICICNGLQGLARCSDLILFQAHFVPLAHADFNLSCFGIYDALECAVFAIEFAQECVIGDEIRPLEWWFVGVF